MKKINDDISELPLTRSRKYQLRHPEKAKEARDRWIRTPEGKQRIREINKRYREKHKAVDNSTIDKSDLV